MVVYQNNIKMGSYIYNSLRDEHNVLCIQRASMAFVSLKSKYHNRLL